MCNASYTYPNNGALTYYATWLGPSAPRIAATHGAAPLPDLVEAVLAELTAAGRSFTAYDVTLVLRALLPYPRRELPHYDQHGVQGVQPEVHCQMAHYLASGDYTSRIVRPNGADTATLYTPARPGRGRGLLSRLSARVAAPGASSLPAHAWVVKKD